jgi:hypothetical protein
MVIATLAAEAPMSWSTIGHRLIVRTLPLLMSAVLLAFG